MQTKTTSRHSGKGKKAGPGILDGRKLYFCGVSEKDV
jgi:hypothetical protein